MHVLTVRGGRGILDVRTRDTRTIHGHTSCVHTHIAYVRNNNVNIMAAVTIGIEREKKSMAAVTA